MPHLLHGRGQLAAVEIAGLKLAAAARRGIERDDSAVEVWKKGQIGYLIQQLGSAKAAAQEIGVTADSVNPCRLGAPQAHPRVLDYLMPAQRLRLSPRAVKRPLSCYAHRSLRLDRRTYKATVSMDILSTEAISP
ncbi:hypothetical protein ACFWJP_41875 [Streptomyces hawaiiensis]|uniref:hypothetical protein n=1 Tax=Streptomyces hawaiiensis TaxID=67305 RepID=UPI00364D79BD